MPVLTCGGMRFQHRWDEDPPRPIPAENQANLEQTIHRALELGIRHIETARGYGTSEAQLGPILQKIPRDHFILQTKVAPQSNPDEFEKIFQTSLSRLGLPWVDLFSLHGINDRETWSGPCVQAGVWTGHANGKKKDSVAGSVFPPTDPLNWWRNWCLEDVLIM